MVLLYNFFDKYYWTDNVSNIIGTMNVPWLKANDKKFAMPADLDDESDDEINFEEDDVVSISDVSAPGAFSSAGKCAQCDVNNKWIYFFFRNLRLFTDSTDSIDSATLS